MVKWRQKRRGVVEITITKVDNKNIDNNNDIDSGERREREGKEKDLFHIVCLQSTRYLPDTDQVIRVTREQSRAICRPCE